MGPEAGWERREEEGMGAVVERGEEQGRPAPQSHRHLQLPALRHRSPEESLSLCNDASAQQHDCLGQFSRSLVARPSINLIRTPSLAL